MKNEKILKLFIAATIISTIGIFMYISTDFKSFSRVLLAISIILNFAWIGGLFINLFKKYLVKS